MQANMHSIQGLCLQCSRLCLDSLKSLSGHSHTCSCFVQCMRADGFAPQTSVCREASFKHKHSCPESTGPCSIPSSGIRNLTPALAAARATSSFLSSTGKTDFGHIKYGMRTARAGQDAFSSQHGKRRQFGGGTRGLWLSTSATPGESKRECLPIRKQLQLHLQTASFVTFKPTLHLPGQVKGSAWPCRD